MLRAQAGTQPKKLGQGFSVLRVIKYEDMKLGRVIGIGSTDCPIKLNTRIPVCWETNSKHRLNPETVNICFKSKFNNFTLFSKSRNKSMFSSSRNVSSSQPMNFSPISAAGISVCVPAALQVQLDRLLLHVACGEQEEAEALLKQTPTLALYSSDVTDLSGRIFNGITAFQYAVWALDWHMWTMIRIYLPDDKAQEQAQGLKTGTWVMQYGSSVSWQSLLEALHKYSDLCNKSLWFEAEAQWCKGVGGAQRLLPAHVINEYCHPARSFEPCPDFSTDTLPRSRKTDVGEWFTAQYNGGRLGDKFAILRYSSTHASARSVRCSGSPPRSLPLRLGVWRSLLLLFRIPRWRGVCAAERVSCHTLLKTRIQQRDQLLTELLSHPQVYKAGR